MKIKLPFLLLSVGCATAADTIVIQPNDVSAPQVRLDLAYGSNSSQLTVTSGMPAPGPVAAGTENVGLLASATDEESGIKNVRIWVNETHWRAHPQDPDLETIGGPGLAGGPRVSNPDPATRSVGDQASRTRVVGHSLPVRNIRLGQGVKRARFVVWAEGITHAGVTVETPQVTITSP